MAEEIQSRFGANAEMGGICYHVRLSARVQTDRCYNFVRARRDLAAAENTTHT